MVEGEEGGKPRWSMQFAAVDLHKFEEWHRFSRMSTGGAFLDHDHKPLQELHTHGAILVGRTRINAPTELDPMFRKGHQTDSRVVGKPSLRSSHRVREL